MVENIGTLSGAQNTQSIQKELAAQTLRQTTNEDSTPARIVEGLIVNREQSQQDPERVARAQIESGQRLDVRV